MPPKPIVPPENEISVTHTELTLEREKIVLERERLALERERLASERDRWRTESEVKPAAQGRLAIAPATLVLAALLCCVLGALVGVVLHRSPASPQAASGVAFQLQTQTQTNEQGEVRSVFLLQTIDKGVKTPSRVITL